MSGRLPVPVKERKRALLAVFVNDAISETVEPGEDVGVGVPVGRQRVALSDFASFHGLSLHCQVNLDVPVGRRDADMAEPAANHVDFDAGLKQVHGGRMTKRVWDNPTAL